MIMEIISKSQENIKNKISEFENNNIFSEYNYKYIFDLKMNKIKEEIKDYIIDKYTKKIIEQNKEIINIKNQLDNLTKKYIDMIKLIINKYNIYIKDNNYTYNNKNKDIYLSEINKINLEKNNGNKNNKIRYYPNNLEKNKIFNTNKNKINENKKNIKYNLNLNLNNNNYNINNYNNNFNYLNELNKKDLKKISNIQGQLKTTNITNNKLKIKKFNSLKNKNSYSKIYNSYSKIYNSYNNKINKKDINKINTNEKKNKIKERYSPHNICFNTEENKYKNKKNYEKCCINSRLKYKFYKELKTDYRDYTFINSSLEFKKNDSNEINSKNNIINNYNNKNDKYKTIFYKYKKINNSKSEFFKENISVQNIFEEKNKHKFICSPVFSSYLNRIENN